MDEQKITLTHKNVIERLVYALSSGLWGIVLDRNLVDIKGVEEFFGEIGLWGTFIINTSRNLTVIRVNEKGLRNKCLYESCSRVEEEKLEACLGSCVLKAIEELKVKLLGILKNLR